MSKENDVRKKYKLKKCPVPECGSEDVSIDWFDDSGAVFCVTCQFAGPRGWQHEDTNKDLAKWWNALPRKKTPLLERLSRIISRLKERIMR